MKNQKTFFIGIDLGWKEKKTTGICVLKNEKPVLLKEVFGKDFLKTINPYLKETKIIGIDAPLTQGRGKGKMRLYEKFLSTAVFRKEKINPLPPALISKLTVFGGEIAEKLEKKGFILGINLIEVFPAFVRKICRKNVCFKKNPGKISEISPDFPLHLSLKSSKTENRESSLLCAQIALLHFKFKTRWIGYKDGFLFLPETSFWEKNWQEKFHRAWREKDRLKYRRLITNIF